MSDLELITYILSIFIYLAPIVLVLNDPRATGQEKNGWLLTTLLLSWLGWLIYISTVKKHPKSKTKPRAKAAINKQTKPAPQAAPSAPKKPVQAQDDNKTPQ